jgi:excisionase family DNA binding protein
MTETNGPATLTVAAAAKLLGIGRQTAYDLAAQGKLPGALRLGRRIVVSKKMLERFLEPPDTGEERDGQNGNLP